MVDVKGVAGATPIEKRIVLLRGERVMLSTDLALYGVEPRVLVQAVKRNLDRFPDDFMFQLTREELANLKSQIVISSWGGLRQASPYAFTEQGGLRRHPSTHGASGEGAAVDRISGRGAAGLSSVAATTAAEETYRSLTQSRCPCRIFLPHHWLSPAPSPGEATGMTGAPVPIGGFRTFRPALGGESETGIVEFQTVARAKVSGTFSM
jgi:ORF6N domain